MGTLLDQLWSVQELQTELYDLRRLRENESQALTQKAAGVDDIRRRLVARRDDQLRKQAEIRANEVEAKAVEEHRNALRVKLNACRNDREYKALLSEIATSESRSEECLQRAYRLEEELKTTRGDVSDLESRLARGEADLRASETAVLGRIAEIDKRLEALRENRQGMLADVSGDARATFERLSEKYEGFAMVAIETLDDGTQYSCSSCNMALTAGVVSAVITGDVVRTCPTCSRMLYYPG